MDLKLAATVFATVFVAEIGDKTQLATLLFASDKGADKAAVLAGAVLALAAAAAIGVLAGSLLGRYVSERHLRYAAGLGFVAIGVWTLVKA